MDVTLFSIESIFQHREQNMMAYRCPRCEIHLHQQDMNGVAIEYCPRCSGLCFDRGELDKVTEKTAGSVEYCTVADASLSVDDGRSEIGCPKCETHKKMRKAAFVQYTDIVVDHCDACGVIWLDTGELDAINRHIQRQSQSDTERSFWSNVQMFAVKIASMGL